MVSTEFKLSASLLVVTNRGASIILTWEGYQLWGRGLVWNRHGYLVFNWDLSNCKERTFFICRFIERHIPIHLIWSYWLGTQSLSITQPHPHPIDVYSACCSKYFPAYFTQPEPKPWQRLRPVLSILCMLLQNYSSLKIENFWAAETPKKIVSMQSSPTMCTLLCAQKYLINQIKNILVKIG